MKTRYSYFILPILVCLLLPLGPMTASESTDLAWAVNEGVRRKTTHKSANGKRGKEDGKPVPPKKTTPYDKLFKDKKSKSVSSFLTLHKIEDKLYIELPDSLLDREMVITTRIESTSDSGDGYAGQPVAEPYIIAFSRADSTIYLHEIAPMVATDDDPGMRTAAAKSHLSPIVNAFKIEACNRDSSAVVFDATSLWSGSNKKIQPIDYWGGNAYAGFGVSTASYKANRSFIKDIAAGRGNVSVLSELSFDMTTAILGFFYIRKDQPTTITARRTISLLPETTMKPRLCDERIGLYPTAIRRFSAEEQGTKVDYFAMRRNIFDSEGHIKPIVFYIDTTFPAPLAAAIERGVLMWNEAFEEIGLKEVLQTRPLPKDDPSFDLSDPTLSTIRFTASPSTTPLPAITTDPRSGEIIGSTIMVPFNIAERIRSQLWLDLSAVDPDVRAYDIPDRLFENAVAATIAGRVGMTLGILPNYAAATAYPTDSLRSPTFTARYGICPTIITGRCYNTIAQPGDKERGVKLIADAPGVYDRHVIRWLYTPVNAQSPEQERDILSEIIDGKCNDPFYQYGERFYRFDPRISTAVPGNDIFRSVSYRIENLKRILDDDLEWLSPYDPDYTYRVGILDDVAKQVESCCMSLIAHIGGIYQSTHYQSDRTSTYTVVPKAIQKQALKEVLDIAENLSWLDGQPIAKECFGYVTVAQYVQRQVANQLSKSVQTLDMFASKAADPYTVEEATDDLIAHLTRRMNTPSGMSDMQKRLQVLLLKRVIIKSKVDGKASGQNSQGIVCDEDSAALLHDRIEGWMQLPGLETYATMYRDPAEAYASRRTIKYVTTPADEHVYFGILMKLQPVYERGARTASNPATRNFCKYMKNYIDRSLSVD